MDYIELGKNIRKFRILAQMRQEDLAEKCDCSSSLIGQVEHARTKPSLETVVRIANALSVTVDRLLCDNYDHPEDVYLKDIAGRMKGYSAGKRIQACKALNTYLDMLEEFSSLK